MHVCPLRLHDQKGIDLNKRRVLLLLFAILLSSLTAVYPISVHGQATDSNIPSGIGVYSPRNMTYDSHYLFLNLTLNSAGQMGYLDPHINMNYSIDGKYNGAVPLTISNPGLHVVTNAAAYMSLPKLSEGSHCLTLYLFGWNQRSIYPKYLSYVETVYFSVSSSASDVPPSDWVPQENMSQDVQPHDLTPPKVSILSPMRNESFKATNLTSVEVSLNFTVDETASQLRFSLDEQPNATIAGNFTFRGLSVGLHNLTVYAWDSSGNVGASETVDFTITATQQPETQFEPSLIPPVAASVASIGVAAVAALVYAKKRKR